MFRSFRLRMAVSFAGVIAAIVLALGGTGYVLLARALDHDATTQVRNAAQGQVNHILEHGAVVAAPDSDVPSSTATRIAVFRPDGTVLGEASDVPAWLHPGARPVRTVSAFGERVRIVTLPVRSGGVLLATVVAGRSLATEADLSHHILFLLEFGGLITVALGAIAGGLLASAASRPIRRAYDAQAAFAADASHEFRTPLTFLRSGLELVMERDPELGAELLREVTYLTKVTERLLALARIERGDAAPPLGAAHVAPLCRSAVERNARALGVAVEVDAQDVVARADPVFLQAALDAVLENVARHGGGRAALTCARDGDEVVIAIADHGKGMTAEQRAHAFERFYRADPSRSRDDGGAGLGLALASSLTRAQSGEMTLRDTAGGGLTVEIRLEAARAGDPEATTYAEPDPSLLA